jgi:thymidylate synthase
VHIVQQSNNVDTLLEMYRRVLAAPEVTIRGSRCRNVHNMAVVLDGSEPVMTSFAARRFNPQYAKREWLWYLGADPMDASIEQYAAQWAKIKQPDGSYFSNYGQYMFGGPPIMPSQFEYVVETLLGDINSRRASMVLLQPYHLFHENRDVVCTYAINFTIEELALHMTVMMRSNDVIWGFTNDAFCFSSLMEFVYLHLASRIGGLVRGSYTHFTNSMHVYDRHYGMIERIVGEGRQGYERIDPVRPTLEEAKDLVLTRGKGGNGEYVDWLQT